MSKSILQEIATYSALIFNNSRLKTEMRIIKEDTKKFQKQTVELLNTQISDYKIENLNIIRDNSKSNNDISTKIVQFDVSIETLKKFTIIEISAAYKAAGIIRKEYKRNKLKLDSDIQHLQLKKLEDFMGPVKSIEQSADDLFSHYGPTINDSSRNWIWINGKNISYQDHNIIQVNSAGNAILIGDSQYSNIIFPGPISAGGDLIVSGIVTVNSVSNSDSSLSCNGHIITSSGRITSQLGFITNSGGFIASSGDIRTSLGGMSCSGDILTSTGKIRSNTGFTTTSGGLVAISGDIRTNSGSLYCTGTVTASGSITTSTGNITITNSGNIHTNSGDISSGNGDLILSSGNVSAGQGIFSSIISATNASFSGTLIVTGATTLKGLLSVEKTISIIGTASHLNVGGNTNLSGNLIINKDINQTSGTTTLLNTTTATLDSTIINATSLEVTSSIESSTLRVNSTSVFTGDINATGQTITASLFDGVASSANYADLAEMYTSDKPYPPGTILSISSDKLYETELYNKENVLAGVVSTKPGYLLNSTCEGVAIALKGRVPILTDVVIKRGEYIIPDINNPGKCVGIIKSNLIFGMDLIGVAINDSALGFVEVKI